MAGNCGLETMEDVRPLRRSLRLQEAQVHLETIEQKEKEPTLEEKFEAVVQEAQLQFESY
jgi:hypothetical protein